MNRRYQIVDRPGRRTALDPAGLAVLPADGQLLLPEMTEAGGVPRSQVSREAIEAGERLLKDPAERGLPGLELLAVRADGLRLGGRHVMCAVGVDAKGYKHVLGLRRGATATAAVATALPEDDLVRRGLDPAGPRLFVIDGSGALRSATDAVFGADQPVQGCRDHKRRGVTPHLPEGRQKQAPATMRAAFEPEAAEGAAELGRCASWPGREWPGAAASLREGPGELSTVSRLVLTGALRRRLGTTGVNANGPPAARERMRRVRHWRSGGTALRRAAAFEAAAKVFRRAMGSRGLGMLGGLPDERDRDKRLARHAVAG
jgi:putative transposase